MIFKQKTLKLDIHSSILYIQSNWKFLESGLRRERKNLFLYEIQIEEILTSYMTSSNSFNTFATIMGVVFAVQPILEHIREKEWRKLFLEACLITGFIFVFSKTEFFFPATLIASIAGLSFLFCKRVKTGKQIRHHLSEKTDEVEISMIKDSTKDEYTPKLWDFSQPSFKKAELCLSEKRPKEAIYHLNQCSGKIKSQVRFVTHYADALIMLDNYRGALAKLNSLSDKQLNKKKRYKNVMVRKAVCNHCLNQYVEELNCYDKILETNYKPEKYLYYRGKVKTRILEIYSYLKSAENAITQIYGSLQLFIESICSDFDKALSLSDKYKGEILSYKGVCHFYLEEYQTALDYFYESRSLTESLANNYVYFGIYYYQTQTENLKLARTYLEKGIFYEESNDIPYYYLAQTDYQEKQYDSAILSASKSLSLFPYRDECYFIQGKCYGEKRMYEEAILCYTKAIELKRKEPYFKYRALCYFNKTRPEYEKAYQDSCQVLRLKDSEYNRFNVLFYKTKCDWLHGDKKELQELEESLRPFAQASKYYCEIGLIYSNYGYLEEAETYYRKALAYKENDITTSYNLALLLKKLGKYEDAVELLKRAISSDPMALKYYTVLKECYQALGDLVNESAIEINIHDLKYHYMLVNKKNGDAVFQLGKYAAAQTYYQTALDYISENHAVLNNLACTFYHQEEYEKAITYFTEAVKKKNDYYLAYHNLGNCYLRTDLKGGNKDSAVQSFQKALALCPSFEPSKQLLKFMDPEEIKVILDTE
jgi:tetratricopeptide (TPR) repeat protein